ncbi:MAG: cryptochrome/photolyase family protein [Chthonomonas sp.]|nr:cryptochrome/photolyase family protein [Chthonomonas sp.]
MPTILVLGDQLFDGLPGMPDGPVFMQEDRALATGMRHHQQKVTLFFSAMRHFAAGCGREVRYVRWGESDRGLLENLLAQEQQEVVTYEPHDAGFAKQLRSACAKQGVRLTLLDSPGFLTSADDWTHCAAGTKRRLMADFYQRQRLRLGVLMDGDQPEGGQWSFDADNRKPVPRGKRPPSIWWPEPDGVTQEVIKLVEREFTDHPGAASDFRWPVTHEGAREWLSEFLESRFAEFGPYEDAMLSEEVMLWHSGLSMLINCGLLTPREVVDAALQMPGIPIASREGFIRQVIGWREFIRGIDRDYHQAQRSFSSPFGNSRKLGSAWWDGSTGLPPLDTVIRRVQRHGWCHHIERLMIAGSAMLMSDVDPHEAYRWFTEMFIDSADWVMAPNVYGMSQLADGGLFATKPYISGSAYILKMSDLPRGEWCEVWDGLYWRFIHRNRNWIAANRRMGPVVGGFDRLEPQRRDRILNLADEFIARTTTA